jgi:hypothetical protein
MLPTSEAGKRLRVTQSIATSNLATNINILLACTCASSEVADLDNGSAS